MIPVGRDEALPHLAEIPAAFRTPHNIYPAITCKKLHTGKTGYPPRNPGIHPCRDEIFPKFPHVIASARLSWMKQ